MRSILAEQLKQIMQSFFQHHRYAMFYDVCGLFLFFLYFGYNYVCCI